MVENHSKQTRPISFADLRIRLQLELLLREISLQKNN